MTVALLAAFTAAACYGVASVLQAVGARRPGASVLEVTRSVPYLIGVALDVIAFLVSTVALRQLPLFSVQAIVASSIVVTVVLAIPVLGTRMRRTEILAIGVVCAGLLMLGLSSSSGVPNEPPWWLPTAALAAAVWVAIAAGTAILRRLAGPALALLAGLAFGLIGLSVRLLEAPPSVLGWLTDPATYALVLSGALALLLYAAALRQWQVTSATAVVIALDTVVPATVGLLWLGDSAAPGRGWLAGVGFAAALGGAIALSRLSAELDQAEVVPIAIDLSAHRAVPPRGTPTTIWERAAPPHRPPAPRREPRPPPPAMGR